MGLVDVMVPAGPSAGSCLKSASTAASRSSRAVTGAFSAASTAASPPADVGVVSTTRVTGAAKIALLMSSITCGVAEARIALNMST